MKIQLKRSNVLEGGSAKAPTAAQMEYGELAVNYNTSDPVIFIKDSSNGIIRLTNTQAINDGEINVEVGTGLTATGSNATANQAGNTTRTISIDETWLGSYVGDGEINISAGFGLTASGTNAKANQSANTTRTLTVQPVPGYGIAATSTGVRIGDDWSSIPML